MSTRDIQIKTEVTNVISGGNNTINIHRGKKITEMEYPPGCIGHETIKANYINHLIDRYNQYKEYELKDKMNYAVFRLYLKRKYKIGNRKIEHIPITQFEELVLHIQSRIDKTKLARLKGKSHRNYSSFKEYEAQSLQGNIFTKM